MKVTGNKSISSIIKIFLQIVLLVGIVIYVLLPILLKMYIKYINIRLQYIPALVLLYISGLPAIIIVAKLIELFNSIKKDNPFIRKNVDALKTISVCSLIISIEYIIGIFVVTHSIFAIIVVEMFVIAWLGSYVLAELLQEAISFKEENDLTI